MCSVDADCNDGDSCTDDTCGGGTCQFEDNGSCAPGPFVEVDGLLVVEAENFELNTPQGSWDWVPESDGAASGGQVMHALPDGGTINNTGYVTNSPRLDFPVLFNTPGTYFVWVLGRDGGSVAGSADSVHQHDGRPHLRFHQHRLRMGQRYDGQRPGDADDQRRG